MSVSNLPPDGFMVSGYGDNIMIIAWQKQITKAQALNLAAWLVALSDPSGEEFQRILTEVRNT